MDEVQIPDRELSGVVLLPRENASSRLKREGLSVGVGVASRCRCRCNSAIVARRLANSASTAAFGTKASSGETLSVSGANSQQTTDSKDLDG